MSTYRKPTRNPETGVFELATWHDDYFGRHNYGVEFSDGEVYDPRDIKLETISYEEFDPEFAIKISKKLAMDLNHKLNHKKNEVWAELRAAIREQSPYCLVCGSKKDGHDQQ